MNLTHMTYEVRDEIATLTLNRPEARNALSPEMRRDFDTVLPDLKARAGQDIKALIITGAGGAFCAGGDVKAMRERKNDAEAGRKRMREAHNRLYDLMNLEMPVIAAVDGPAAGAGVNIALAADFILASPRALFMQAFGRIGLVPDWGGFYLLPRIVGLQKAKELIFTARKLRAEEARQLGIVYAIHPSESLMDEARAFAGRFRNASTTAIGLAKNVLNQSFNLDHRTVLEFEAMAQAVASGTAYHAEATRRFAAKEPAMFDWDAFERAHAAKAAE